MIFFMSASNASSETHEYSQLSYTCTYDSYEYPWVYDDAMYTTVMSIRGFPTTQVMGLRLFFKVNEHGTSTYL